MMSASSKLSTLFCWVTLMSIFVESSVCLFLFPEGIKFTCADKASQIVQDLNSFSIATFQVSLNDITDLIRWLLL